MSEPFQLINDAPARRKKNDVEPAARQALLLGQSDRRPTMLIVIEVKGGYVQTVRSDDDDLQVIVDDNDAGERGFIEVCDLEKNDVAMFERLSR